MDRQGSGKQGGDGVSTPASRLEGVEAAEFAEYLRAERERRQVTLQQVADETKIASRHLEALERGDVRNWPGGMYRRAMMRAYAESIGVDREYALKQFEQAFEPPPAKPAEAPAAAPRLEPRPSVPQWRPSRGQVRAAGVSLAAVVALAIVWNVAANFTRGSADTSSIDTSSTAISSAAPEAAITPVATAAVASSAVVGGAVTRDAVASRAATGSAPTHVVTSAAPASASVTAAPRSSNRPAVVLARETAATSGASEPRIFATEGTLVVASDPPGARVTVNGIGWGDTPVTIRHLEFGEKRIRLTMQGYLSQERVVRLGPERASANVRVALRERGEITPGR